MIVWGGTPTGGGTYLASGGRYDPQNDQWMPTSMAGAPSARYRHTAIWSGETMIVWGGWTGTQTNTGGQYDPRADRWTPTSFSFAPSARENHSAVWTGAEMVVWGGDVNPGPIQQSLKTGARYDPFEDSWIAIADAPQAMNGHSAVWTGTEMMVWTGSAGQRYDLAGNTWRSVSTLGAPTGPTAIVWAGDFVLAWGSAPRTGGRYAIDTDHDGTANQCDSDDDNDGAADGADCAPELASVAAPPGEVSGVLVSRSPGVHVAWNPQSGARYDIAAGLLETLRSTGGTFQASCGANSIAAVAWDDPSPAPSPGEGLFYLIRAENACGAASYGSASSGTQREVADDCP
jgi:hypothetical protein